MGETNAADVEDWYELGDVVPLLKWCLPFGSAPFESWGGIIILFFNIVPKACFFLRTNLDTYLYSIFFT